MRPSGKRNQESTTNIFAALSSHLSRRQLLKVSLVGLGGLAATATGVTRLEALVTAAPSPGRWYRLDPKTAPSPRWGATMAYDAARGVPVLFGGARVVRSTAPYIGSEGAETWIWDGRIWARGRPPQSPPARYGANCAYHPPTKTVVLFGGVGAKGELDDTWLWDGRAWRLFQGKDRPGPRREASMAFDPVTGSILLCGGFREFFLLRDTWKWDGKAWAILPDAPAPSPMGQVGGAGLAYSAAAGGLLLFGGYVFRTAPASDETYVWRGNSWSQFSLDPSPPGRIAPSMAADPAGRLVLLFGGEDSPALGDTWTFTGKWTQRTQTPAPSPRSRAVLAPAGLESSFLLFGGRDDKHAPLGDTWAWGPF